MEYTNLEDIVTLEEAVDYINDYIEEKGGILNKVGEAINTAKRFGHNLASLNGKGNQEPTSLNKPHYHKSAEEAAAQGVYGRQKAYKDESRQIVINKKKEELRKEQEKRDKKLATQTQARKGLVGEVMPTLKNDHEKKLKNLELEKKNIQNTIDTENNNIRKSKKNKDINSHMVAANDAKKRLAEFKSKEDIRKKDNDRIYEIRKRRLASGLDPYKKSNKVNKNFAKSAPTLPTKESVDELRLTVYEAFDEGFITESEKDLFLDVLVFEE